MTWKWSAKRMDGCKMQLDWSAEVYNHNAVILVFTVLHSGVIMLQRSAVYLSQECQQTTDGPLYDKFCTALVGDLCCIITGWTLWQPVNCIAAALLSCRGSLACCVLPFSTSKLNDTVKYLIHKHLAALVLKDFYMNVPFRYLASNQLPIAQPASCCWV